MGREGDDGVQRRRVGPRLELIVGGGEVGAGAYLDMANAKVFVRRLVHRLFKVPVESQRLV